MKHLIPTIRWRYRWVAYETLVMRPAYAVNFAQMTVAYGQEADEHYGDAPSLLRDIRRYITGFCAGALSRKLPDWFVGGWFKPIAGSAVLSPEGREFSPLSELGNTE